MSHGEVLIIGAGPAGMATAHALESEGIAYRLVDRRGTTGGAYRDIYGETELASPTRYTVLPGPLVPTEEEYVRARQYRAYLDAYASSLGLVAEQEEVRSVARDGNRFRATFASGETSSFRAVVVATGMFDHPRLPSIASSATCRTMHSRSWAGPGEHIGSNVLVVGGATSAVEIAEECAAAGVHVTISARSGVHVTRQRYLGRDIHTWVSPLEKLPVVLLRRFCDRGPTLPAQDRGFRKHVRGGRIRVVGALAGLDDGEARFAGGETLAPDVIVFATGFRFATPFLPGRVERAQAGHPRARAGMSVSWPGLFFVGMPCARRLDSEFLRGFGKDAAHVAAQIRTG